MTFWSSLPKNSLIINQQVGADKRFTPKPIDPQHQNYIDHTIEHSHVIIGNTFTNAEVDEANGELLRPLLLRGPRRRQRPQRLRRLQDAARLLPAQQVSGHR